MKEGKKSIEPGILDEIVRSLSRINYGEVTITVHDSRIVQIEKKEKKRFRK